MTKRSLPPPRDQSYDLPENGRSRDAVRRVVFGKRLRSPEREISFRRERLRIVASELNLLFSNGIDEDGLGPCFAELVEDSEPRLVLGRSLGLTLSVEIETESGLFVLYERLELFGGSAADSVLITGQEERLLDHIVGLASAPGGELAPRTADAAVDMLVGRTLAEVERRLTMRTFLYFKGDCVRTAAALGLAPDVLRSRVRQYLLDLPRSVKLS